MARAKRRVRVKAYSMRRKGKLIHVKAFLRKRPKR